MREASANRKTPLRPLARPKTVHNDCAWQGSPFARQQERSPAWRGNYNDRRSHFNHLLGHVKFAPNVLALALVAHLCPQLEHRSTAMVGLPYAPKMAEKSRRIAGEANEGTPPRPLSVIHGFVRGSVSSDMVEPLYLDERIEEQERVRIGNVLGRWLKKLIPALAYHGPPLSRRSVETQLRERAYFPSELWKEYGPPSDVAAILDIIRKELHLPNHHFIPDDPVVLVMRSGYDTDDVYALIELEEWGGVKFEDKEVERIRNEEWTLGQFVKEVFEKKGSVGK